MCINPAAAAAAKSLQSCLTLCDPIDSSPPASPVPGILQARTLEWAAISFSNGWKWKVKVKLLSHVWLLVTPWTAAYQAPLSMGFSRQEYWSGVPLPSPMHSRMWDLLGHSIIYSWTAFSGFISDTGTQSAPGTCESYLFPPPCQKKILKNLVVYISSSSWQEQQRYTCFYLCPWESGT